MIFFDKNDLTFQSWLFFLGALIGLTFQAIHQWQPLNMLNCEKNLHGLQKIVKVINNYKMVNSALGKIKNEQSTIMFY